MVAIEASPLKNFAFSYDHEGSSFMFHVVARTAKEAQQRLASMASAQLIGELKPDQESS